jgi:Tol biopolymer transport system component
MDGTSDIFIMDLDGSDVENLTEDLTGSHERDPHCEMVSGVLWVVYSSNEHETEGEIYKVRADGTGSRGRLTNNQYPESNPAWCKGQIVFQRDVEQDDPGHCEPAEVQNELFLMDSDGSNVRRLTSDCHGDFDPACSPDGTQVAFTRFISYAEASKIFRMNMCAGPEPCCSDHLDEDCIGHVKKLTFTHFADETDKEPSWSPGGTMLAFASDRPSIDSGPFQGTTDYEIYFMHAVHGELELPGGFLEQVTDTPSGYDDQSPHWGETRP